MTFSIIAHEQTTGQVGIAVASKSFATGARVPLPAKPKATSSTDRAVSH